MKYCTGKHDIYYIPDFCQDKLIRSSTIASRVRLIAECIKVYYFDDIGRNLVHDTQTSLDHLQHLLHLSNTTVPAELFIVGYDIRKM